MLTGADIVLLSLAIGLAVDREEGKEARAANSISLLILYACLLIWR